MQTFNLSFLASDDALVSSAFVIQGQDKKAVVVVPRDQLDVALSNSEFKNLPHKGVYVLLGEQRFYVGKTSQGLDSVKQLDGKDFWQVAVLCVADVFDREMMDGVEAETAAYLLQHSGLKLENEQQPSYQYLSFENQNKVQTCLTQFMGVLEFLARNPLSSAQKQTVVATSAEGKQADMQGLQQQVEQLTLQLQARDQDVARLQQELQQLRLAQQKYLGAEHAGHIAPISDSHAQAENSVSVVIPAPLRGVLHLQIGNISARMSYRGEKQWVVLAGSLLRGVDRKEEQAFVQKTIAEAKENNTITLQADGTFVTNVDFTFSSPSAAKAFVYVSGVDALDKWRNDSGVTLRELLAQVEESITTDAAADSAAQPQATATEEIPEQLRDVLLFQARNLTAKMSFRGVKQWVVLAGSQLRGVDRRDTQVSTSKIIAEAKEQHELTEQADGSFVTNRDFLCKTPSAALALVLGGEGTDALTHWHNEAGVPLRTLLAQSGLKEY